MRIFVGVDDAQEPVFKEHMPVNKINNWPGERYQTSNFEALGNINEILDIYEHNTAAAERRNEYKA